MLIKICLCKKKKIVCHYCVSGDQTAIIVIMVPGNGKKISFQVPKFPRTVSIVEVGPRDGLQNEKVRFYLQVT